jgi:DNA primase
VSVWEDIKDRLSVEEVIADYIPIVNAGSNLKAVCPFHQEKTPSLMISPAKGIWHCFGCGAGGDIFEFVTQIENIDKQESLKRLAKKAAVDLNQYQSTFKSSQSKERSDPNTTSQHEYGLQLLQWTADIYHKILLKILQDYKHPVTIYCRERNLTQDIIERFKIGFAPRGNGLLSLAKKHSLNTEVLLQTGILKKNERGISDKFKDRLMIPIHNSEGSVVGFTGRILPGDTLDRPKYLNSSQSEWFNKSHLWFGLHFARPSIIRQKNAIIVEGNMDVVSCHQAGLTTAIASQGTSFTHDQLKILKRATKKVSLAFDNDEAGILASKKFFIQANQIGLSVNRVVIPQEFKDIDEYISTASQQEQLQIQVIPYFQWYVSIKRGVLRDTDMNVQRGAIEDCVEIIESMDELMREQSLKLLADTTELPMATLKGLLSSTPKLHEMEEEGESRDIKPTKPIINCWKNYIALHHSKEHQKDFNTSVYTLLNEVFGVGEDNESYQEYLTSHAGELEVIAQELQSSDDDIEQRTRKQLMIELDREAHVLSLQPKVLQHYITIKQSL